MQAPPGRPSFDLSRGLLVVPAGSAHRCRRGTHSRIRDGRMLCWTPENSSAATVFALDAELGAQPVPQALGRRSGITDAAVLWRLWTRAEVRAKVRDVPIVVWLHTVDWVGDADLPLLPAQPVVEVVTTAIDDLIVSFGALSG